MDAIILAPILHGGASSDFWFGFGTQYVPSPFRLWSINWPETKYGKDQDTGFSSIQIGTVCIKPDVWQVPKQILLESSSLSVRLQVGKLVSFLERKPTCNLQALVLGDTAEKNKYFLTLDYLYGWWECSLDKHEQTWQVRWANRE